MSGRSISSRLRSWLLAEMDLWRGAGILSEDQVAQIVALYETPADIARQKSSLAQYTLMGLAASMVGLAGLLLIGYNWSAMPAALKLSIVRGISVRRSGQGRSSTSGETYRNGLLIGCAVSSHR